MTGPGDGEPSGGGWSSAEEAKERAREAVAAAYAERPLDAQTRTCPSCGAESATFSGRCPACNKRFDRRLPWLSDRARWAIGVVAFAGLVFAVLELSPHFLESKRERSDRLARERTTLLASERARLLEEQKPVRGVAPASLKPAPEDAREAQKIEARRLLVGALEAAILANAQDRIRRGDLDGPVKEVLCDPLMRSPSNPRDEDDLAKSKGRYDCVAVKRDVVRDGKIVARFGHPFIGTVDFERFTYVFCKDNKVPGESGKALTQITLEPACFGLPKDAARLGSGYITPED